MTFDLRPYTALREEALIGCDEDSPTHLHAKESTVPVRKAVRFVSSPQSPPGQNTGIIAGNSKAKNENNNEGYSGVEEKAEEVTRQQQQQQQQQQLRAGENSGEKEEGTRENIGRTITQSTSLSPQPDFIYM